MTTETTTLPTCPTCSLTLCNKPAGDGTLCGHCWECDAYGLTPAKTLRHAGTATEGVTSANAIAIAKERANGRRLSGCTTSHALVNDRVLNDREGGYKVVAEYLGGGWYACYWVLDLGPDHDEHVSEYHLSEELKALEVEPEAVEVGGFTIKPDTFSPSSDPERDFDILDCGSIVLFTARCVEAIEWWEEHVQEGQQHGRAYAVEPRFAPDIALGIVNAGLTIG